MGARKVSELTAEGANVRRGYRQASQESEGISRDGELYQDMKKLLRHGGNSMDGKPRATVGAPIGCSDRQVLISGTDHLTIRPPGGAGIIVLLPIACNGCG